MAKARNARVGPGPRKGAAGQDHGVRYAAGAIAITLQAHRARLRWTGKEHATFRSSPTATRDSCADCGTALLLRDDGDALLRLTAGSLDRPDGIRPAGRYGIEGRLEWTLIGKGRREETTRETL